MILALLLPKTPHRYEAPRHAAFGENVQHIKNLLSRRGLNMSYVAIFAQYFVFGGVATLLPLYVKGYGMTAFHVGMLLMIFTIVFIAIQYPSGLLSDRVGRVKPTIAGLALGAVSLALLPAFSTFLLLAVAMALYGLAYGLFFPSISAAIPEHASQDERGLATGIFYAALTAGVAVGAPVMGGIGEVAGIKPGLLIPPFIMLLALVVVVIGVRRK
ncbi:MAG: MFS transporter [Chloroflexi bacterium]|nr:MFS transporter [Chloroflexota bacterium]